MQRPHVCLQALRVFLHFLPPFFGFGHEDSSWQKFFSRFFTQPLAVFLSLHFLPATETVRVARQSSSTNSGCRLTTISAAVLCRRATTNC